MPIAKLVFKLPEEREELEICQRAGAYYSALFEMREYLRKLSKYPEKEWDNDKSQRLIEMIRDQYFRLTEDLNI